MNIELSHRIDINEILILSLLDFKIIPVKEASYGEKLITNLVDCAISSTSFNPIQDVLEALDVSIVMG